MNNLEKAKKTLRQDAKEANLDTQGKRLEKDLEGIVESTQQLLQEKNPDEKLQALMKESKQFVGTNEEISDFGTEARHYMDETKPKLNEMQQQANQLYGYVRQLSWDFVRSPDFRVLLADWVQYFQWLSVSKMKEKAMEKEEEYEEVPVGEAIAEGLQEPPKPDVDEMQQRTEDKFHDLLEKLSSTPEYQNFVKNLLNFFDFLRDYFQDLKNRVPVDSERLQIAFDDAKDFVGEFCGKKELDDFTNLVWNMYNRVLEDEDLNKWFRDLRSFVDKTIHEPESLTEEDRKNQAEELSNRGKALFQEKEKQEWRADLELLKSRFQTLVDNVRTDSTTQEWTSKLEKFGRDLIFNEKGLPDIFVLEDSIYQLKNLIVPLFKKTLENVPIKRIEVSTDTYDARVDDILFDATTFLPDQIDFKMLNASHMDLKNEKKDASLHQMLLQVDHIKPEFKKLKFYYRRKSFPKIEDYGIADLALKGDGACIRVIWTIESRAGGTPIAQISEVKCTIDKLNIHIVGEATKHDWLDTLLLPIFSGMIKNKISNTLEEYLRSKLNEVNTNLNEWFASRPAHLLKQKADQALKETYQKIQFQQAQKTTEAK